MHVGDAEQHVCFGHRDTKDENDVNAPKIESFDVKMLPMIDVDLWMSDRIGRQYEAEEGALGWFRLRPTSHAPPGYAKDRYS